MTYPATERLFNRADEPAKMVRLRATTIARLIYPAGFYRRKAEQIREMSRMFGWRSFGRLYRMLDGSLEVFFQLH